MDRTLDRQHHAPSAGLDLALPALPEQVGVVRHEVERLARVAGLAEIARRDVALAVSEACANVVVHAYAAVDVPAEDRVLLVRADAEPGVLRVEVGDRGSGMVPRHDSPGMGLGLPLMASLTDELEVREADRGGTTLRMTFRAAHAAQAASPRRIAAV